MQIFKRNKKCTKWGLPVNMKSRLTVLQTEIGYDFVTIYDGSNDQSTQIEKLSGNLGSFNISSTGNSLFVKFESDYWGTYAGFLATIHYGSPYLNTNDI